MFSFVRLVILLSLLIASPSVRAGSLMVVHEQPSGSIGFVPLGARVDNVVSLTVEDSPTGGGNLVSQSGIYFGNVNSIGSTDTPGVNGSQQGNKGHYEAEFSFTALRSGQGAVTLFCKRSIAGNFNPHSGVEIDDHNGVLRPLRALFFKNVLVLDRVKPGTYEKTIAINIYPRDTGELRTQLQFTLSAF